MNYLKDQDLYGLLFKDVVTQYVVVENNNLKEFVAKMGVENVDNIPNKIENAKISEILNYDELKSLFDKYLNTAIEAINEDNYSKIEKESISLGDKPTEASGYQIKLKSKDIQAILIEVLQKAKDDEQIFNLVNKLNSEDSTFEDYQNSINEILTQISGEISNDENVDFATITVYKQGKNAVKLAIKIIVDETNSIELSLDKVNAGLMLKYNNIDTSIGTSETSIVVTKTSNSEDQQNFEILITKKSDNEEETQFNINLSRTGALTSNNVKFSISIPITDEDSSVNIQFNNTVNFSATPQSEEFNETNHLVVNNLSQEQINNLITNLGKRLSDKLKNDMFISSISNISNELSYKVKETDEEIENAIEEESTISDGMVEVNGQRYSLNEVLNQN